MGQLPGPGVLLPMNERVGGMNSRLPGGWGTVQRAKILQKDMKAGYCMAAGRCHKTAGGAAVVKCCSLPVQEPDRGLT